MRIQLSVTCQKRHMSGRARRRSGIRLLPGTVPLLLLPPYPKRARQRHITTHGAVPASYRKARSKNLEEIGRTYARSAQVFRAAIRTNRCHASLLICAQSAYDNEMRYRMSRREVAGGRESLYRWGTIMPQNLACPYKLGQRSHFFFLGCY